MHSTYLQHFRMSKDTFWFLSQTYSKYLERQDTRLRHAIPAAKRLAIVLHWVAHAPSFSQLAAMYALGKSTVIFVVHQGIDILRERLTPNAIMFLMASELQQVMVDFEALCGLPCCAGALDGTFMPIKSLKSLEIPTFVTRSFVQYWCWHVWMPGGVSCMLMLEDLDQLVICMLSDTAFCMKRSIVENGLHILQH